jgi:hypothetical protein
LADQLGWQIRFMPGPTKSSSGNDFSDAQVPAAPEHYRTLSVADLNADGKDDVCIRLASGLSCGLNTSTTNIASFGAAVLFPVFRDSDGYGDEPYGSTVQLGDLDNDRRAEVCGRRPDGIYCARNTGAGAGVAFATPSKRLDGFRDGNLFNPGWESSKSRFGSLRMVDLDEDGWFDLCGRGPRGIECALNKHLAGTAAGFSPATLWALPGQQEFVDGALIGWQLAGYGSTVQFADIDGDHRVDVCGRGTNGIICAINDGAQHFIRSHIWTSDFKDADGWDDHEWRYGTIRLGDIDGDGRADVCGRGANGLMCGRSLGQSFSRPALDMIISNDYTDAAGWNQDKYSSFAFLRLDADSHLDLCARGPTGGGSVGLFCGSSP